MSLRRDPHYLVSKQLWIEWLEQQWCHYSPWKSSRQLIPAARFLDAPEGQGPAGTQALHALRGLLPRRDGGRLDTRSQRLRHRAQLGARSSSQPALRCRPQYAKGEGSNLSEPDSWLELQRKSSKGSVVDTDVTKLESAAAKPEASKLIFVAQRRMKTPFNAHGVWGSFGPSFPSRVRRPRLSDSTVQSFETSCCSLFETSKSHNYTKALKSNGCFSSVCDRIHLVTVLFSL